MGAYNKSFDVDFLLRAGRGQLNHVGWYAGGVFGRRFLANSGDVVSTSGVINLPADAGEDMEVVMPVGNLGVFLVEYLGPNLSKENEAIVIAPGGATTPIPFPISRINNIRSVGPDPIVAPGAIFQGLGGGTQFAEVLPENQRLISCVFSIPADHTAQFIVSSYSLEKSTGATESATFEIYSRSLLNPYEVLEFAYGLQKGSTTSEQLQNTVPGGIPGPTTIIGRAKVSTDGNTDVNFGFTVIYSDNAKVKF